MTENEALAGLSAGLVLLGVLLAGLAIIGSGHAGRRVHGGKVRRIRDEADQ